MKSTTINNLLDQIQFFSQEFPVFAKTGESFNMAVLFSTGTYTQCYNAAALYAAPVPGHNFDG
jgi:hypothetical protein